jgi:hypothetical protein
MPSRVLREGLLDSDAIGAVSVGAELLFVRLLLLADDFGRYDGRVSVICRRAFVNRRSVDEHMTADWLHELDSAGLVRLYEVDNKPYLELQNFRQRTRAQVSKYPARLDAAVTNQPLKAQFDGQAAGKRPTDDRPTRTYSESESESEFPLTPKGVQPSPAADAGGDDGDGDDSPQGVDAQRSGPIEIRTWLAQCAAAGEKPVPTGCAALQYAQQAGIPDEFIVLHWREFKTRHAENRKRYRDWRKTLLNSLRGNWYGLWHLNADGSCNLTTKGQQAKRVQEAMASEAPSP